MTEVVKIKLEEVELQNLEAEVGEGISEVSIGVSNIFDGMVEKLAELRKNF